MPYADYRFEFHSFIIAAEIPCPPFRCSLLFSPLRPLRLQVLRYFARYFTIDNFDAMPLFRHYFISF